MRLVLITIALCLLGAGNVQLPPESLPKIIWEVKDPNDEAVGIQVCVGPGDYVDTAEYWPKWQINRRTCYFPARGIPQARYTDYDSRCIDDPTRRHR